MMLVCFNDQYKAFQVRSFLQTVKLRCTTRGEGFLFFERREIVKKYFICNNIYVIYPMKQEGFGGTSTLLLGLWPMFIV